MFPEYKEINGRSFGYELDKFIVFDVPKGIPFNLFTKIERFLDDGNIIPRFDDSRNIIDSVYSDFILVEYLKKDIRDKDVKIMNKKKNIINPLRAEKLTGNRQVANPVGNFEYNGKYYLVLNPYNPFTLETIPEKGIYKGVIVNPELYFGEIGGEINNKKDQIDKII